MERGLYVEIFGDGTYYEAAFVCAQQIDGTYIGHLRFKNDLFSPKIDDNTYFAYYCARCFTGKEIRAKALEEWEFLCKIFNRIEYAGSTTTALLKIKGIASKSFQSDSIRAIAKIIDEEMGK